MVAKEAKQKGALWLCRKAVFKPFVHLADLSFLDFSLPLSLCRASRVARPDDFLWDNNLQGHNDHCMSLTTVVLFPAFAALLNSVPHFW